MKNGTVQVDAYMLQLVHPLKAEIEAVRQIILSASPKVEERVKWNSPSFYYPATAEKPKEKDILAIHWREQKRVHLVLVYPVGLPENSHGLLEGDYKDRRMAYFDSMEDIAEKKDALTAVIRDWVGMMER